MPFTFEYDDYPIGREAFLTVADTMRRCYPDFKASVFCVPSWMDEPSWNELRRREWIEIGMHGFRHAKRECRSAGGYTSHLHLLDDNRYAKVFKAPWYGYSMDFVCELEQRGFVVCIKSLHNLVPPTDVLCWDVNDARRMTVNPCQHIESHPCYPDRIKSKATEINERNLIRWTSGWTPESRFEFVSQLATPMPVKISLGCGTHVWDGWRCCDPRPLDPRIIDWDFARMIPCADNRADVVLTSHTFNYLFEESQIDPGTGEWSPGYVDALLDIWRVLRPGGVLRMAEDRTESGHVWRHPGQRSRRTGTVRSVVRQAKILESLTAVGFVWNLSQPGHTISPHRDVLDGDSRERHWNRGRKFYVEAVKQIDIPDLKRCRSYDPRARRKGRYQLEA